MPWVTDAAFELGLVGFALAQLYYGLVVKSLTRVIRWKTALWLLPCLGALVFLAVAGFHAWGAYHLTPQLTIFEGEMLRAGELMLFDQLDQLQQAHGQIINQLGQIRLISFVGILSGSLATFMTGAAYLWTTSR